MTRLLPALAALAFVAAPAFAAPAAKDAVNDGGPAQDGQWSHAFAQFGEPKYPKGFTHFEYVNPDAPKGGTVFLGNPDRRTSFDKFNPFTVKGSPPTGVNILMFEPLAVRAGDEPGTMYGLLAEEIKVAPDRSSITFRLNPKARFYNGDPVLAADVKHSFDMLTSKGSSPAVRAAYEGVAGATILDERTIRFDLKEKTADNLFLLGAMAVFSRKWGAGPDGKPKPFDAVVTEYPITSGPYTIASTDSGRGIEFVRNKDYWGRDLPVRKGQFNFDRVVYRLYRDRAISMEAFKAGEFDIIQEFVPQQYVRLHAGPKWRDGRIIKRNFAYSFGKGQQAYLLNLRRPIFADRRVRQALDYTYDFEKINLYDQRVRNTSLFVNSDFAAKGMPSAGELALLEPFRKTLSPEVFGPAYVAPRTDTGPNALRENLKKAQALFAEAGWNVAADGVMRNAKGDPFEIEYLETQGGNAFRTVTWQRNLAKLGIKLNYRVVDFALYRKRLEVFDFDLITIRTPDFTLPSAVDYQATLGSARAAEEGSGNFRGVKNPAVDAMIEAMGKARTYDELRDAARALDRIVMHEHYQVPQLYQPSYSVSYWDKFGIPKTLPKYYTIDEFNDDTWPTWAVSGWWSKSAEAPAAQAKAGVK
jgi:peptide/nickel transport system substrate-binding protein/microcin C transport system substrate-binding protein